LRGNSAKTDENYKEVANMYATMDDENQDKIMRSIKRAWSDIKFVLGEYYSEDKSASDNALASANDDLVVTLAMPTNFAESATDSIAEAIHNYLSNSTIAEWYMVVNKADAPDYMTLATQAIVQLKQGINKRKRPTR
jgi:histidinol phosphatase-like PHP family hydrolase